MNPPIHPRIPLLMKGGAPSPRAPQHAATEILVSGSMRRPARESSAKLRPTVFQGNPCARFAWPRWLALSLAFGTLTAATAATSRSSPTSEAVGPPPNTLTAEERAAGWRLLFDGTTTKGWRSFHGTNFPASGWIVADGWLKHAARAGGGDIVTLEAYEDFELTWEWRIPRGANNGVKYLVRRARNSAIGHEYQMIDDATVNGPKEKTATFYDVLPRQGGNSPRLAPESNHSRILVRGHHVEHWLNGEQVLTYELDSPALRAAVDNSKFRTVSRFGAKTVGPILLTDHTDEASFRNLKIRRLPPETRRPFVADPDQEFQAAQEAERRGDFDRALEHYENLFDAARLPARFATRALLHRKLGELRRKVPANTNPARAGEWRVKAYVFRTTDVRWTDEQGTKRHAFFRFSDPEIANLRHEMTQFAAKVWDYTSGHLQITWDLTVIDVPLTEWHGWPDPGLCMRHFTDLRYGEADSLFVFAKAVGGANDEGDPLHWDVWGGTIGVTAETQGAAYVGFNCGPDPAEEGSGELELHEWMHAAEMAMRWAQAYGDEYVVDWTSDGGGQAESWGLWKRPEGDRHWLDFYQMIFRDWSTRRMWRELTVSRRSYNPWLNDYVRDALVLGPFPSSGLPNDGLDEPFIDEDGARPTLGAIAAGREWRYAWAPGKYLMLTPTLGTLGETQVAYLAFVVRSANEQPATLWHQRDGLCKIWQNGGQVLASRVGREWNHPGVGCDLTLRSGTNLFLVKLTRISSDWAFQMKLTGLDGRSLPDAQFFTP